ncbi:hypothetical protein [Rubritalea tangerina]|uniref:hypothetical protein n=1 Tax=Rubritalea tangerina TaxID=430798 RepID=UPI003609905E
MALGMIWMAVAGGATAQMSLQQRLKLAHEEQLEQVRVSFHSLRDPYRIPPKGKIVVEDFDGVSERYRYTWKRDIPVTIFWVGEDSSANNPTHNHASSWDPKWIHSYGGVDDPVNRNGYFPAKFRPKMNPFYIALPYNDVARGGGRFKPEASHVIKWFWRAAKAPGKSVCKGRWLAIHSGKKVCYAQWEDCGPFYTDDYEYVFQNKQPKPNRNGNAGLDISPAVRDFLGVKSGQRVSWKFVEAEDVPVGPWQEWVLPQS